MYVMANSLFDNPALELAVKVGAGLAAAQLLLGAVLASPIASPIARREPAFVAHQLVTLPLMMYVSYLGCAGWFFPDEEAQELAATVEGRLYGRDPVGEKLSAIVLGAMVFWDIWATLLPSIYSAAGMGHHVGLAILAAICLMPYLQHYAPFFVGVIEISSVPLVIVDLFHPKHFAYVAASHPFLSAINEAMRLVFALSFLVLRTVYFPVVIFTQAIPDLATQLQFGPDADTPKTALAACGISFALLFTGLQLHWSWLLIRQVLKGLTKESDESSKGEVDLERYNLHVDEDDAERSRMLHPKTAL